MQWKRFIVFGAIGFGLPLGGLVFLYCVRLWLTGFPSRDTEQDVATFPVLVLPIAVTCGVIAGLASIAARNRGMAPTLWSILIVAIGAILPVLAVNSIFSFGLNDNLLRCMIASLGALCAFGLVRYQSKRVQRRDRRVGNRP